MSNRRERREDIVQSLMSLEAGRVKCFLEADFEMLRQNLEAEAPDARLPIVLLKRIDTVPTTSQLIQGVLLALATTARNLWPIWYTDIDFGLGRSGMDRVSARSKLSGLTHIDGLSVNWGRRALARTMDGKLPLVPDFPRATQLHQLRLAVSRTGFVLVIALDGTAHPEGSLANLARAARWLAENAKLAVAVLLGAELEHRPSLAHILYDVVRHSGRREISAQTIIVDVPLESNATGSCDLCVWLGRGRTQHNSEAEAKLAKALLADAELGVLFSAGQTIPTRYSNYPTVDLLWQQGRVVVEVDGDDHREAGKYADDRRRDFELSVSDYLVLRVQNRDVLTDTEKVVAMIREFVSHRRQTRPDLARFP